MAARQILDSYNDKMFERIVRKEYLTHCLFEDEEVLAFYAHNKVAPDHFHVVSKRWISGMSDVKETDIMILGKMIFTATKVAEKLGMDRNGYRVVVNCGKHGCNGYSCLNIHVIGGMFLGWPPGT